MVGPNAVLIALGGVLVAVLAAFFKGRLEGARAQLTRQAEAEIKARDIADQVDNDVGAMPSDVARKELSRWARKK
jgi:hypothetical protein